jgi:hypothetical protein
MWKHRWAFILIVPPKQKSFILFKYLLTIDESVGNTMYDRDRYSVRNGPPIGTSGVNWGRLAELRRYYPQLWQQFVDKFPNIKSYG